jgi:hypothetical protein
MFWNNSIKRIFLPALLMLLSDCSASSELKVVEYKTVSGSAAAPWPSGCLVTVENRTQRFAGLYGLPCDHIQIGDRAAFHSKGETVFWVNDIPYTVSSASSR